VGVKGRSPALWMIDAPKRQMSRIVTRSPEHGLDNGAETALGLVLILPFAGLHIALHGRV
jgi:hypothetical protein